MKICFFGVGGVGGYFGAFVVRRFVSEHEIYFVARGKHKDAIKLNGLTVIKSGGAEVISVAPKLCTDDPTKIPVCDIIILSVKGYDLDDAVRSLSAISGKETIILPLLNGVDIYDRIRKILKTSIVLPSCVYVGTHIASPGIINQNGGDGKILLGTDPQNPDYYPQRLLDIFQESGIQYSWESNVEVAIWSKYMFIAAYGLVTATYDKSLGEILDNSELSELTISIMQEIEKISRNKKIPLEDDIVKVSFNKARQFPYETKTSFQRDVESKGKINEADLLGGTIIRFGDEFGIPTPTASNLMKKLMSKFEC